MARNKGMIMGSKRRKEGGKGRPALPWKGPHTPSPSSRLVLARLVDGNSSRRVVNFSTSPSFSCPPSTFYPPRGNYPPASFCGLFRGSCNALARDMIKRSWISRLLRLREFFCYSLFTDSKLWTVKWKSDAALVFLEFVDKEGINLGNSRGPWNKMNRILWRET